jgi:amino acid transporter
MVRIQSRYLRICQLIASSIKQASSGDDETVDDKDDPAIRSQYDRDNHNYPYKSHGQWARACYSLLGCFLLAFFNGWRSLAKPVSAADFFGCYVSVSALRHWPEYMY